MGLIQLAATVISAPHIRREIRLAQSASVEA